MQNIKNTLRLYAKNRKLPVAVKLSIVPKDWISYAQKFANDLTATNDVALSQRVEKNIYGTEIENYESLTKYYNQRYFRDIDLPNEINQIDGVHHLRFGILEQGGSIPFHLDEPYNLRFICMIQGSHKYHSEKGESYIMTTGDLWFINGSFKHSVENISLGTRIALLGKFPPSQENLRLINELL